LACLGVDGQARHSTGPLASAPPRPAAELPVVILETPRDKRLAPIQPPHRVPQSLAWHHLASPEARRTLEKPEGAPPPRSPSDAPASEP
jgi:hypothetical protein